MSQSAIFVDAVRTMAEADQDVERIVSFPGIDDGPAEALSEQIDRIPYGGR